MQNIMVQALESQPYAVTDENPHASRVANRNGRAIMDNPPVRDVSAEA
jgi:hypothetical protein